MALPAAVHPLQPRFAQAVTGALCLEGALFQTKPAIVVALVLILLSLAGPRWSPVGWVFRQIAPPAAELEPAAPPRFAQGMAAVFLAVALGAVRRRLRPRRMDPDRAGRRRGAVLGDQRHLRRLRGLPAAAVAGRRGGDGDVRADLGLEGRGPWLVVLTAPGCTRCEPVARQMESAAGERAVLRVSLVEHPRAASLPVRSVPAALAVGGDGRVRMARAGRLDASDLEQVLAAV